MPDGKPTSDIFTPKWWVIKPNAAPWKFSKWGQREWGRNEMPFIYHVINCVAVYVRANYRFFISSSWKILKQGKKTRESPVLGPFCIPVAGVVKTKYLWSGFIPKGRELVKLFLMIVPKGICPQKWRIRSKDQKMCPIRSLLIPYYVCKPGLGDHWRVKALSGTNR